MTTYRYCQEQKHLQRHNLLILWYLDVDIRYSFTMDLKKDSSSSVLRYHKIWLQILHSIAFSGGVCQHSAKASRGEDVQMEEPVGCR